MINIKNELAHFQDALKLCIILINAGGEVRFIGGAVRDIIAGLPVTDIDLASNLLPEKIEEILKSNQIKYLSIGKEFGTITAIINKQLIEITTLRCDISCDGRHAKVSFSNDWQEDAMRRDFTINALSADMDGNVYDYLNGLEDLKQHKVKFIGDAETRLLEDNLRILRFFRFSAYFADNLDEQGLAACIKHADKFSNISISRFRSEMKKFFTAPKSLEMLDIMQQHQILPCKAESIIYLKNLTKIMTIFNYPANELLFLAVLLRGFAQEDLVIHNSAFSAHERDLLELLVYSNIKVYNYESLKKLWQKYKYNFKEIIMINLAVHYADPDKEAIANLNKLFILGIKELPISGKDLIAFGVNPGKEIGNLLAIAEDIWYNEEFKISKDQLLDSITRKINLKKNI